MWFIFKSLSAIINMNLKQLLSINLFNIHFFGVMEGRSQKGKSGRKWRRRWRRRHHAIACNRMQSLQVQRSFAEIAEYCRETTHFWVHKSQPRTCETRDTSSKAWKICSQSARARDWRDRSAKRWASAGASVASICLPCLFFGPLYWYVLVMLRDVDVIYLTCYGCYGLFMFVFVSKWASRQRWYQRYSGRSMFYCCARRGYD